MKRLNLIVFIFVLAASVCALYGADDKTVKLPDGRVLHNPYILSRKPTGLEVGHRDGVLFVRFDTMPKKAQEKYNYDPVAAARYDKEQSAKKQARERRQAKLREQKAAKDAEMAQKQLQWRIDKVQMEIKTTELRIATLKQEIPKLEKEADRLLDRSENLAGKNVGSRGHRVSGGGYWGGGFVSVGGSQRGERSKRKVLSTFADSYSETKSKLRSYKRELEQKQVELLRLKRSENTLKKRQSVAPTTPK